MEVHRMRDRAVVRERDLDHLPLADMDHRTGCATGPGPGCVLDAGSDLHGHVLEDEVDVGDGPGRDGRHGCGERLVRGREGVRVRRGRACVARHGAGRARAGHAGHTRHRLVAAGRCLGRGALGCALRVVSVEPHRRGEDGEDRDEDAENRRNDRRERVRIRFVVRDGPVRVGRGAWLIGLCSIRACSWWCESWHVRSPCRSSWLMVVSGRRGDLMASPHSRSGLDHTRVAGFPKRRGLRSAGRRPAIACRRRDTKPGTWPRLRRR